MFKEKYNEENNQIHHLTDRTLAGVGMMFAQAPVVNIDRYRHGNLASAQSDVVQACQNINQAQQANDGQLGASCSDKLPCAGRRIFRDAGKDNFLRRCTRRPELRINVVLKEGQLLLPCVHAMRRLREAVTVRRPRNTGLSSIGRRQLYRPPSLSRH
jgi:hypothetical protein